MYNVIMYIYMCVCVYVCVCVCVYNLIIYMHNGSLFYTIR